MPTGDVRSVAIEEPTKRAWEPMTLTLVGSVAALIQGGTMGTRGDGGATKKV